MKKLALISSLHDARVKEFASILKTRLCCEIEIFYSFSDILDKVYDLVLLYSYDMSDLQDIPEKFKVLRLHSSLLPAFDEPNPVKAAFVSGVKVSGVTIIYLNENKILAQFPVLLDFDTHFDEFEANIKKTEFMLYPLVIKSFIENKVFSFSDLMGGGHSSCGGNCGSCGGCGK